MKLTLGKSIQEPAANTEQAVLFLENLQKGKALPAGTIREWKGKKYKKDGLGEWKRVTDEAQYKATTGKADAMSMQDLLSDKGKSNAVGEESGTIVRDGISTLKSKFGSTRFIYSVGGKAQSVVQVMSKDGKTGTITNVYTLPEYRRKGLSAKLVKQAQGTFSVLKASDALTEDGAALMNKTLTANFKKSREGIMEAVFENVSLENLQKSGQAGSLWAVLHEIDTQDMRFESLTKGDTLVYNNLAKTGLIRWEIIPGGKDFRAVLTNVGQDVYRESKGVI